MAGLCVDRQQIHAQTYQGLVERIEFDGLYVDRNTLRPTRVWQRGQSSMACVWIDIHLQRNIGERHALHTICFLFVISCNFKLLSFFVKSFTQLLKYFIQYRRFSYLKSFRSSLQSLPLWVTLYVYFDVTWRNRIYQGGKAIIPRLSHILLIFSSQSPLNAHFYNISSKHFLTFNLLFSMMCCQFC